MTNPLFGQLSPKQANLPRGDLHDDDDVQSRSLGQSLAESAAQIDDRHNDAAQVEHAAHVFLVLLEFELHIELRAEEHFWLDAFVLLQHLAPQLDMGQLHVEEFVPDLL